MKRQPITYEPTPDLSAERPASREQVLAGSVAAAPPRPPRRAPVVKVEETTETEMLSARVNIVLVRQFRALAKLRGTKVQSLLQTAISEYLERNRF